MTIRVHTDLIQGSDEWLAARRGLLTASEMKLIITPTLKVASNDKERAHLYELLAQRVTEYVEPSYISDDMLRGMNDEEDARQIYAKHIAPVERVGFITNDKWGFTIGYSPDGCVGDDGLIEIKSRRQKYQAQTIVECVGGEGIPPEYAIQVQTGLLVSERQWCDLISYCGGMPLAVMRVHADPEVQFAIVNAAGAFEARIAAARNRFEEVARDLIPTERKLELEMHLG